MPLSPKDISIVFNQKMNRDKKTYRPKTYTGISCSHLNTASVSERESTRLDCRTYRCSQIGQKSAIKPRLKFMGSV